MAFKILITAFDVSADHNIADWIFHLKKHHPNQFTFEAFAGEKVAEAGASLIADTAAQSSIGFFSSLKYIPSTLLFLSKLKKRLLTHHYDLVLCVDGQGRNLIIGKIARKLKIKTAYYFPPTVFIFGKSVLKKMEVFDLILCSFSPNYDIYKNHKLPAVLIGHPFSYLKKDLPPKLSLKKKLNIPSSKKIIALFPGSREQEIKKLLPLFLKTVTLYQKHSPDKFYFVISLAHQHFADLIEGILRQEKKEILVLINRHDEILKEAAFAICASGTVTFKASFFHLPHVICYQVSSLTYWIAKNFIIYVKYIGMLNILATRPLIKELINKDLTSENIFTYSLPFLIDKKKREEQIQILKKETDKLIQKDPFEKFTTEIIHLLKKK